MPNYDPYWNRTPKQRAALILGQKIRSLKGVSAAVNILSYRMGVLTPTEIGVIDEILVKAEERARKDYEAEVAQINQRIKEEPRQYTGK